MFESEFESRFPLNEEAVHTDCFFVEKNLRSPEFTPIYKTLVIHKYPLHYEKILFRTIDFDIISCK